ncbi:MULTISPECIES: efflux RND transporter periplasmic adaptor subunit [Hyphomicrobium]|uniref:efflux RND transporter periplasmic adaptor subunit n=1 Tax=Hyphomicrobium TaxID=81 RepID=UPI00036AA493|nr:MULTISPECIES: efflux RND transporter periplasmic adaptor subunit [Hyphomicrobium]WBT37250.1 efflux RND transporter periplasmic adaptor subunit [Hyphomicrobium sp. DMF-1]
MSRWSRASQQVAPLLGVPLPAIALLGTLALSACSDDTESAAPDPRPVRTTTVEKRVGGQPLALTGRVEAANEAALGFRISGRMAERTVGIGDRVEAGQVVARLEPQNEMNALRSAQANLAAAHAALTEARNRFERQETLLSQGWTTRALYDQAEKARATAEAQLDAAEAQLKAAHDLVSFTELEADAPGVVTATGAEPHEVVQAGQMIVRLAREDGKDGVFDVPAQVLRSVPADVEIEVRLSDDPSVKAAGRVRTVAPQADPTTRTFEVKVGLTDPPEAMRLGATVTGQIELDTLATIEIPASALTKVNLQPAVWIVNPADYSVSLRNVEVARFDPATVMISDGLDVGDVIVTAGVQALHPGQRIRILGAEP